MPIKKIEAGRVITKTIDTFIGTEGTIFYDEQTGELRLSDGVTPGGIPIGGGAGGNGYTGSQGVIGYNGSQGYTGSIGYTGTQGDIGFTGSTGTQGDIGFTGSTGTQGVTGFTGSTGTQGVIGFTGSLGDKGDQGLQGTTGIQGPRGYTGEQGVSVTLIGSTSTVGGLPAIGNPGDGWIVEADGDLYFWNTITSEWNNIGQIVGPQGAEGLQGNMGPQGPQGNTGTQGEVGVTGSIGFTGSEGYWGSVGYIGSEGYWGSVGYTGSIGYTGSEGYWGSVGYTGSEGYWGSVGYTGSEGYWGSVGYTGSIGYTGSEGYTGSIGYTGSEGYWGSVGYTGSIGYTGSAVIGLTSNATDTVTLSTGFKFIPETDELQDLGDPTHRFGKLYLAGQTIDLGGTIISTAPDGGLLVQKTNGDLEKITVSSLKLGSTGTDGVILSSTGGVLSIESTSTNFVNVVTTGTITVLSTKTSTSTLTGALIISGGAGIGGDLYLGSSLYANTTSFVASAEILTTATIEQYAITPDGIQTLTNKTIIIPSGNALYFQDDIALAAVHGASSSYKQTSAAPKMFTNASFGIVGGVPTFGTYWADSGGPDYGYNTVGTTSTSADLPAGYTGTVYDAYTVLDTGNSWLWLAPSTTDMKPGDYYYDDINQTLYICYEYTDPDTGLPLYNNLDITPR